ncbi:MAG: M28 family peptidase, partial [Nitrospinota bacterium]
REFIRRHFQLQGLHDVKAEEMEYLGYRCDSATLSVTTPQSFSIPCEGLGLSALTPDGGVEAPVVYAEEGAKEDYDDLARRGHSCIGRIVLADAFKSYQAVPLAEENWAAGFILGTRLQEEVARVGVTNLFGLPGRIPAVAVTSSQSRRLQALASQRSVRAQIEVKGQYRADESEVLVGRVPGPRAPEEIVFVVSHFDSHGLGPHAADNASGTGALLDLAGFFSRAPRRRTVCFLGLAAEEFGFLGARSYVSRHPEEMARAKAVVNLDGIICAATGRLNAHVTEETRALVEQVVSDYGIPVSEWHCPPRPFSDHIEFYKAGVPVAWLCELDDFYHTVLDQPANLDRARFEANLKAVARIIWGLAGC